MKFLRHLIKKHWFLALLLLVALWLLPKLITAYAYLFQSASDFVAKVGSALRIPQEYIAKVTAAIERTAGALEKTPFLSWLIPIALFNVAPIASAILSLWGILDVFKANETITITRTSTSDTQAAPAPSPLLMPGSNQTVNDFFAPYGTDL